ncbi:HD domain-containing protein [Devosia sp. FJ2-5-3]|uniref:HD domain-containing protein n=1 Tax=Devosia sp. FJ2-5-3 TaxID=2976680 RepID=UPI0023D8B108|nr:HD domain-containing protein [Devosia sp. FJ2-5-3]WEJ56718.1 HD domain-containing protein [Devosia sp. FJ2-5-3]
MLSIREANILIQEHLGEGLRARHSVFVGFLMARLAPMLGEDSMLWEVIGLVHDLDFDATAGDRSRHGLLTAEWLEDDLPDVALLAIRSHDHRTGIISETALALALKLADAVAAGELDIGREGMVEALSAASPIDRLEEVLSARPYLPKLIVQPATELLIPLEAVASICRTAPEQ